MNPLVGTWSHCWRLVPPCCVAFPSSPPMLPLGVTSVQSWFTSKPESKVEGRAFMSTRAPGGGGQWNENRSDVGIAVDEILRVSTPLVFEKILGSPVAYVVREQTATRSYWIEGRATYSLSATHFRGL